MADLPGDFSGKTLKLQSPAGPPPTGVRATGIFPTELVITWPSVPDKDQFIIIFYHFVWCISWHKVKKGIGVYIFIYNCNKDGIYAARCKEFIDTVKFGK